MINYRFVLLFIVTLVTLPFTCGGCGGNSGGDGVDNSISADYLLEVPFVPNYGLTCASSSFTMVLIYYGIDVTFDDVWEVVGSPYPDYGAFDIWIRENFDLRLEFLSDQTIDDIIYYIDEDLPPIVVQQHSYGDATGHNRVVIGYNLDRKELILNDPSELGPKYRMSFEDFITFWDNFTGFIEPWWDPNPTFLIIPINDPLP